MPILHNLSPEFLGELSRITSRCKYCYPPEETITVRPSLDDTEEIPVSFEPVDRCLCIVMNNGMVGVGGRVVGRLCSKAYWGDDFLLEKQEFRQTSQAMALSYVEVRNLCRVPSCSLLPAPGSCLLCSMFQHSLTFTAHVCPSLSFQPSFLWTQIQFVPFEAVSRLLANTTAGINSSEPGQGRFAQDLRRLRWTIVRLIVVRGMRKFADLWLRQLSDDPEVGWYLLYLLYLLKSCAARLNRLLISL